VKSIILAITCVIFASGCLVHRHGYAPSRRGQAVVVREQPRPACHPSQYWDGSQCRHKGQGNGARKHDGR
jgi:hypothetical protein